MLVTYGSRRRLEAALLAISSSLMLPRRLISDICSNFSSMNSASVLRIDKGKCGGGGVGGGGGGGMRIIVWSNMKDR